METHTWGALALGRWKQQDQAFKAILKPVQQDFKASLSYVRPYYKKIIIKINKIKGTTDLEYLTVRRQDVFIKKKFKY